MLSYDVVEWGKPLQPSHRATPAPTGTEVLLKLKYCGVCHSDVHIRDGYFDLGGGKRLHMGDRGMKPPVTLGHEPFGTVVAAGGRTRGRCGARQELFVGGRQRGVAGRAILAGRAASYFFVEPVLQFMGLTP